MSYPKISVVTVNLNNACFLEETIRSVLDQGYPNLEYILIDGGSADGSLDIIRKYEKHFAYWISEKDNGYGFALQKGFEKSTGDIMAWLNSDDVYHPQCLFTVAELFQKNPQVQWLTGFPSWLSADGLRIAEMPASPESKRYAVQRYDLYLDYSRWSRLRYLSGDFLAIQQESTFWRRELWEKVGAQLDTAFHLAVDTALWCRFFRHAQLFTAPVLLAAFRFGTDAQITRKRRKEYIAECRAIISGEFARLSVYDKMKIKLSAFFALLLKPFYYFRLFPDRLYSKILELPQLLKI